MFLVIVSLAPGNLKSPSRDPNIIDSVDSEGPRTAVNDFVTNSNTHNPEIMHMGYRYAYPERALFRKRLLESGCRPDASTNYETAILTSSRQGHTTAVNKWKDLMGIPLPSTYKVVGFGKNSGETATLNLGESINESTFTEQEDEHPNTNLHVIMAETLLSLDSLAELGKVIKKLNDLDLLDDETRVSYVIEYLTE